MPSNDWHVHEIFGHRLRIRDALANFQLLLELFEDEYFDDEERTEVLITMLYPNPQGFLEAYGDGARDALSETLWECFGIDIDGTREHDEPVLDLDEDKAKITVTARAAYNLSWEQLQALPYTEAITLLMLAPEETPMGQAIKYRVGKPPTGKHVTREERMAWEEGRRFYRLKGKPDKHKSQDQTAQASDAATRAFEERKRRLSRGRRTSNN